MNKLTKKLEKKAFDIRGQMLEMCIKAGTGHVTSSLSCIDMLVALYYGGVMRVDPANPEWSGRDRLFLSKGQASPALYVILSDLGFYDRSLLDGFAQKDGKFGVHLQKDVPGVELTVGSLGQAFGVAAGMALGHKMNRELNLVFSIIGDGECYEGSIWETAMFASHNNLNNLVTILDRNYLCVTDFTENLVQIEPLEDKWRAFGWDVERINGHDFTALLNVLGRVRCRRSSRPLMIIADTVKGEGIDCMSNIPLLHGAAPSGETAQICRIDLERRYCNE